MKHLLLAATLCLLATACTPAQVPPPPTADYFLQQGESFFEQELYGQAIENWEKVRDSFYSPELSTLAEMKIAEAHDLAGDHVEAAVAYEDFLKAHPGHNRTPHILFRLGMSYQNQILAIDRDQTATHNAIVTFESLLKMYPQAPEVEEAKRLIEENRGKLAAHELYVGHFYLRTKHYGAAINRLSGVLERYPDFSDRDQAYFYLGKSYLNEGKKEEAVASFNSLYREFPQSELIPKAQKWLEKHY